MRAELTANKVAFASLRQRLGLLISWTALSERAQQAVRAASSYNKSFRMGFHGKRCPPPYRHSTPMRQLWTAGIRCEGLSLSYAHAGAHKR